MGYLLIRNSNGMIICFIKWKTNIIGQESFHVVVQNYKYLAIRSGDYTDLLWWNNINN